MTFTAVPLYAQDNLRSIPETDPQHQLEMLHVAEGFEVNLFASEPMLVKPIQMNWDAEGRLWVIGSATYPQLKPGEEPEDKIYILDDTTGDGKADKSTVFADGLLMPTGILPGDGGAYVANSTELLHLKDTNGDGKADERSVVLNGFGTADTHHLINSFKWGPDGKLYFNQAIYNHSNVETPFGLRRLEGGGVWQLRPETLELEVFVRGLINPWGLQFGRWGESFMTDGAGGEGLNYAFPEATFTATPGAERVLKGLNPGQPKHAGLEVVSGRHLPGSWEGDYITNDYRANRINRFALEEQGSGYVSIQQEDLLWTDHVAFRPVDVTVGPDGALYIADWYNPIIQHGEVDFRDSRRDKNHGRIWRITMKDRPLVEPPQLVGADTQELLNALKLPENWTRSQAKQILKERGAKEVTPVLEEWIENLNREDLDYEHHLTEALWVYQAVNVINEDLLSKLLSAKNHNARAAAVRMINYWHGTIENVTTLLREAVADKHPRVRLEAVIALRNQQNAEAANIALTVLEQTMDEYLDFVLWQTIRELEPYWIEEFKADPNLFGEPGKTAFALKSVSNTDVIKHLVKLYENNQVPIEYHDDVLSAVSAWGGIADLNSIFDLAVGDVQIHENGRNAYFSALEEAMRRQRKKPDRDLNQIVPFTDGEDVATAIGAVDLLGTWGAGEYRSQLAILARDDNELMQKAALGALSAIGGDESREILINMTSTTQPDKLRLLATAHLASFNISEAARIAITVLQDIPEHVNVSDLFTPFISQAEGTRALAEELMKSEIQAEVAQLGMQVMQRQLPWHRHDDDDAVALKQALEASGGTLPPDRMPQELSDEEINTLEREIRTTADPARGEKIYRRNALMCMNCHALGGAGGLAGPDLSSLGTSAPTDNIIRALIAPNLNVKEGYELTQVFRNDGSVVMGTNIRQTSSEVVLRNAADQEISISQNQIDVVETVSGSLMPPGLTSRLERDEFIDLIGFLSKLGEPGDYRGPSNRIVRRWQVLNETQGTVEMLNEHGLFYPARDSENLNWSQTYSKVSGNLPVEELPVIKLGSGKNISFVRFEVEVLDEGKISLLFNTTDGIVAWNGEEELNLLSQNVNVDLSTGIHQLTVAIDRELHGEKALQVELKDADNSSARARLVMGK
ncbi:MAG: PVC-type heme-binding CxxCH protein [Balneolales bacterium]